MEHSHKSLTCLKHKQSMVHGSQPLGDGSAFWDWQVGIVWCAPKGYSGQSVQCLPTLLPAVVIFSILLLLLPPLRTPCQICFERPTGKAPVAFVGWVGESTKSILLNAWRWEFLCKWHDAHSVYMCRHATSPAGTPFMVVLAGPCRHRPACCRHSWIQCCTWLFMWPGVPFPSSWWFIRYNPC